ncbi:hypothetical protein CANCADRAFT_399 [Tortispora caseinolytica NRRL Y-17796]|uniref:Sugar phosphate transporter domain-containing protein n=1 Tax=Tortispora caseinolytica NRRL Y-17796 TaxID=767744 RepID=A0A1E4TJC2_9ASCO|nr:hypothetical protein CANCADRAFT_399 [Tortispora caseinolytica NRRL Y-17796]
MSETKPSVVESLSHRRGSSVSEIKHQIKDLAPPVSPKIVILCLAWCACSAFSNTLNKSILNLFPYPITLTELQFLFVILCALFTRVLHRIPWFKSVVTVDLTGPRSLFSTTQSWLKFVTRRTAILAVFQLSGHIFSHKATSLIDVSLVHTIKGSTPLFAVIAARIFLGSTFSPATYWSLLPLTVGVMMTCSDNLSGNLAGILWALTGTIVFVGQNLYSKKLVTVDPNSIMGEYKMDKVTLLFFTSIYAFLFSIPVWLSIEGHGLYNYYKENTVPQNNLLILFILNGVSHFGQSLLAFQLLGLVSTVTYSVASLIKRILVIVVAIVWFGRPVSFIQGAGICLSFIGLYLYDRVGTKHQ